MSRTDSPPTPPFETDLEIGVHSSWEKLAKTLEDNPIFGGKRLLVAKEDWRSDMNVAFCENVGEVSCVLCVCPFVAV